LFYFFNFFFSVYVRNAPMSPLMDVLDPVFGIDECVMR
jgi:hypothetical protein